MLVLTAPSTVWAQWDQQSRQALARTLDMRNFPKAVQTEAQALQFQVAQLTCRCPAPDALCKAGD